MGGRVGTDASFISEMLSKKIIRIELYTEHLIVITASSINELPKIICKEFLNKTASIKNNL